MVTSANGSRRERKSGDGVDPVHGHPSWPGGLAAGAARERLELGWSVQPCSGRAVVIRRPRPAGRIDRPEHRLRCRRAREIDAVPGGPERGTRLPDRLAHRERQHQRRLAHRLAAVDDSALVGALVELDPEVLGHLRERGQLVGAGSLGREAPAARPVGRVPAQLLERQPAGALHVAALDLAEVDQRRQRVADVVRDVGAHGAVGAGEAIDLDLGDGCPVGVVLEGSALHPVGVPVQTLGAVVAGSRERDPLVVGLLDELGPRQRLADAERRHQPVADADVVGIDLEVLRGHHGEPVDDLTAGVLDRAAVEIGAGGGCGRRGVRHLVGPRRCEPHEPQRHPQRGRGHLQHLRVQSLAHLGAAVVDQHRAVLVDVHQRSRLVEGGVVEGDAELHRGDRQTALDVRVGRVEVRDLGAAAIELAGGAHPVPDLADPVRVPDRLAIGRLLAVTIEVACSQLLGRQPERGCQPAEEILHHQHPLRAAEAAERRLRRLVGLRDPAVDLDVGHPVGVVDVAQRPGQDGLGEVEAPAAVRGQGGAQPEQAAVVVEPDLPLRMEGVALAGHRHVLGAGQPHPDRAAGQRRAERRDGGQSVRLHLLPAEPTAHPQALHGDLVAAPAQHVGDDLLGLGGVLGARLHEHLTGLVDERERTVGLEVEVLLPAERQLAGEPMGCGRQAGVGVAARDRACVTLEGLGVDRLLDRQDRRQRHGLDLDGRRPAAGVLQGLPEHPGHRMPPEADLGREERLVVLDAGVVDARHVRGRQHADDAGSRHREIGAQRGHSRVRLLDLHRPGVQHPLRPAHQVIGVERGPRHVQARRLVGDLDTDDGVVRPLGEGVGADDHDATASPVASKNLSMLCSSIAAR